MICNGSSISTIKSADNYQVIIFALENVFIVAFLGDRESQVDRAR